MQCVPITVLVVLQLKVHIIHFVPIMLILDPTGVFDEHRVTSRQKVQKKMNLVIHPIVHDLKVFDAQIRSDVHYRNDINDMHF